MYGYFWLLIVNNCILSFWMNSDFLIYYWFNVLFHVNFIYHAKGNFFILTLFVHIRFTIWLDKELCLHQSNLSINDSIFIYSSTSRPSYSDTLDNVKWTINKYQNWQPSKRTYKKPMRISSLLFFNSWIYFYLFISPYWTLNLYRYHWLYWILCRRDDNAECNNTQNVSQTKFRYNYHFSVTSIT